MAGLQHGKTGAVAYQLDMHAPNSVIKSRWMTADVALLQAGRERPAWSAATVTSRLTLPYGSGATEGNVNQLKALSRHIRSRASLNRTVRSPTSRPAPTRPGRGRGRGISASRTIAFSTRAAMPVSGAWPGRAPHQSPRLRSGRGQQGGAHPGGLPGRSCSPGQDLDQQQGGEPTEAAGRCVGGGRPEVVEDRFLTLVATPE